MRKIIVLATFLILSSYSLNFAEKEKSVYDLGKIVISATKTEEHQARIGSSVSVITAEDIKNTGKNTVGEVLRNILGVTVAQTGSFGGTTSVYLRGSKPGHTLVMIDGIEVNDPMFFGKRFNFAHLVTDNIERIEVVRGPQSTLYGSDAMGGIINIITKKGETKPKLEMALEAGSNTTFKESLNLRGSIKRTAYSLSLSRLDSKGISKARGGLERDGYRNTNTSSHLNYKLSDDIKIGFCLHFTDTKTNIDDDAYKDDPNHIAWYKNLASKIEFVQNLKDWWDHKLFFSYSDTRRKYRDEKDQKHPTEDMQSWYKADNRKFEWQHILPIFDWNTLTLGLEYEKERGSSYYRSRAFISKFDRKSASNRGYYLQNQLRFWDSLFITPGLRIDDYKRFGTHMTYKTSITYLISEVGIRFKANWGTAFKAPSLYQLYAPPAWGMLIGNPNLRPEKSKGYDFGFEQNLWDGKLSLSATYFYNRFKDMVAWDQTTGQYQNIGRAKIKGIETEASFKLTKVLSLNANYIYLDPKNETIGRKLARRPTNQMSLGLNWIFSKKGSSNLSVSYLGHRWDDSRNTHKIKPYFKADLFISYNLTDNSQLLCRIDNLLDRKYEEVRGYTTPRRSFCIGSRITF